MIFSLFLSIFSLLFFSDIKFELCWFNAQERQNITNMSLAYCCFVNHDISFCKHIMFDWSSWCRYLYVMPLICHHLGRVRTWRRFGTTWFARSTCKSNPDSSVILRCLFFFYSLNTMQTHAIHSHACSTTPSHK